MLINGNKPILLNQVRNNPNIPVSQLVALLQQYEDLTIDDFKGYVSDMVFEELKEAGRNPQEVAMWNQIKTSSESLILSPAEIQEAQRLTSAYLMQFPSGPKCREVQEINQQLQQKLNDILEAERRAAEAAKEQADWAVVEKGNYNALLQYKHKYPNSVHTDELDDLMWTNTKNAISENSLNRYLCDLPCGRHAVEAHAALNEITQWNEVKRSNDLFIVDDYRDNHPDSVFKNEVNSLYYRLRDEELRKMKDNPSEYSKMDVDRLIQADIFKKWELEDEGLVTDESWERLIEGRDYLPHLQDLMQEDPHISCPPNSTDVFLFGTPGTGKTCLLMGLAGANGKQYTLNMNAASSGGRYAAALQQYVQGGITPGSTYGKFVTTIHGSVEETDRKGNVVNHRINLVEMSGEEFALRIAENRKASLSDMGTGATNLLRSGNRKAFFIIVDGTKAKIKVEYVEDVRDANGNVIGQNIRKKYISQLDILNKFVSLFVLPENQEIMKTVDAIHFIVTKADMLGDSNERLEKARQLLLTTYEGPISMLKSYCRTSKRINYSTNYKPQVFTFSLGKFYLGDVFDFDPTETLKIIDAIRMVTGGTREENFFDKVKKIFEKNL